MRQAPEKKSRIVACDMFSAYLARTAFGTRFMLQRAGWADLGSRISGRKTFKGGRCPPFEHFRRFLNPSTVLSAGWVAGSEHGSPARFPYVFSEADQRIMN